MNQFTFRPQGVCSQLIEIETEGNIIQDVRFTGGCNGKGMSSVPEAIAAKHAGLEIIAISALANAAAGISPVPLSGSDVLEASAQIADSFRTVVDIAVNV